MQPSTASNLVANDTNAFTDLFLRDTALGVTLRFTVDPVAVQINPRSLMARDAAVSADGRSVAFYADFSNLVANDTDEQANVFVRDRSHQPGLEGCFRVSIGTVQRTDRLIETLEALGI